MKKVFDSLGISIEKTGKSYIINTPMEKNITVGDYKQLMKFLYSKFPRFVIRTIKKEI